MEQSCFCSGLGRRRLFRWFNCCIQVWRAQPDDTLPSLCCLPTMVRSMSYPCLKNMMSAAFQNDGMGPFPCWIFWDAFDGIRAMDGYSWKQYWNYVRRQVYVMDTYSNRVNRQINHAMMFLHSYLSLAFTVPATLGKSLWKARSLDSLQNMISW